MSLCIGGQFKPGLILFDLDGTLVDSVPDLALAVDQMLQRLGREPAGEQRVRGWVGNGAPMLVRRALTGLQHPEAEPAQFAVAHDYFLQAYAACATEASRLYDGVRPFLQAVQQAGIPMGVVTNKPVRFVPGLLEHFALSECFSLVLGGDSLAEKKPHPLPLQHAAGHFGLPASQVLMVGDSCNDVLAARAAGCPVACVSYGYNHGIPIRDSAPDWVVDSLPELL